MADTLNPTETYTQPDSISGMFSFSPKRCGCCRLWKDDFERDQIGPYYSAIPGLSIVAGKAKVTSYLEVFRPCNPSGVSGGSPDVLNALYFDTAFNAGPGPNDNPASYPWGPSPLVLGNLTTSVFNKGIGQWWQYHFELDSDGEVFFGKFTPNNTGTIEGLISSFLSFDPTSRTVSTWGTGSDDIVSPVNPEDYMSGSTILPGGKTSQGWFINRMMRITQTTVTASPPWTVRVCSQGDYTNVWINGSAACSLMYLVPRPEFFRSRLKGSYFTIDNLEVYAIGNNENNYWINGSDVVKTRDTPTSELRDIERSGRDYCPSCATGCWMPAGLSSDRTNQKVQIDISGWKYHSPNPAMYGGPDTRLTPPRLAYRQSMASCCESRNGSFVLTRVPASEIFPGLESDVAFESAGNAFHLEDKYRIPISSIGEDNGISRFGYISLPGCAYYKYRHDFGCGEEDMIFCSMRIGGPEGTNMPWTTLLYRNVSTGKVVDYTGYVIEGAVQLISWTLGDTGWVSGHTHDTELVPDIFTYPLDPPGPTQVSALSNIANYNGYIVPMVFGLQPAPRYLSPGVTFNVNGQPIQSTVFRFPPLNGLIMQDSTREAIYNVAWNNQDSYTFGMVLTDRTKDPGFTGGNFGTREPPSDIYLRAGEDPTLYGRKSIPGSTNEFPLIPVKTIGAGTGGCGILPNHTFNLKCTLLPGDLG